MRVVEIIQKKRDGGELTTEEIAHLIRGYTAGSIPDYQMSAWAMAVFFKSMSTKETADLTLEMARSGDQMDLSSIRGVKVDKHSTGGVGDTTTLVLAPLVASVGVPVAKMSGRGLGHTGGTIDKLEAIPGFAVELSRQQFIDQVNRIGLALTSQSGNITPADKKLYALRDVTATVNSIPLIASSVMSKKIASGADAILLDVKTGNGAFMKTIDDSIRLAQAMVNIGTEVGRETIAVITDMDEPLGNAVGNALEVKTAIETLKGAGPKDLEELCYVLGAHMLILGKLASSVDEARAKLQEAVSSGRALDKFREFVAAQGGDPKVADRPELLPAAKQVIPVEAVEEGYVSGITAEEIGLAAMSLGAGRETKESAIDLSVGIVLRKKVGDRVGKGETLAELHAGDPDSGRLAEIKERVFRSFRFAAEPVPPKTLIHAIVTKNGVERMV